MQSAGGEKVVVKGRTAVVVMFEADLNRTLIHNNKGPAQAFLKGRNLFWRILGA